MSGVLGGVSGVLGGSRSAVPVPSVSGFGLVAVPLFVALPAPLPVSVPLTILPSDPTLRAPDSIAASTDCLNLFSP